ncbi:MAG: xylose isomerase, partial [Chitinophagaceae bacterium]|nr:xylose isomerase [Chitinophagaceae bacterium]
QDKYGYNEDTASAVIREHIQICYDVCHFAVGYEDHYHMIEELRALGIKTGKIQISAALKAPLSENIASRQPVIEAFKKFNEPVYLHQVVVAEKNGGLIRYPDMQQALADANNPDVNEWRAHFHVPLFIQHYGVLQSTQRDIEQVLNIHSEQPITFHLEVETYTWEVLPEEMRLPLTESIIREMEWTIELLKRQPSRTGPTYA